MKEIQIKSQEEMEKQREREIGDFRREFEEKMQAMTSEHESSLTALKEQVGEIDAMKAELENATKERDEAVQKLQRTNSELSAKTAELEQLKNEAGEKTPASEKNEAGEA